MTQIEFDAEMKQMNYEQMQGNQQFNDKKEAIDKQINDAKLQILALRSRVQELHIQKLAIQSEQKKTNQKWHELKHLFVMAHPRESMEKAAEIGGGNIAQGHAIQEEIAS